ncbi:MAG: hypothetical protein WC449_06390, partial [Candidatus Paceibacterota bacterium]
IGTTNPSEKLTVIGNGAFADGSTTSTLTKNSLILGQTSSAALGKFYVDSSGNISASGTLAILGNGTSTFSYGATFATAGGNAVGIGTTEPQSKLHIARDDAPTDVKVVSSYLHIGGTVEAINSYKLLTFGHNDGESTNYPAAYFGFQETSASADSYGDFVWGGRTQVGDFEPVERMRLTNMGALILNKAAGDNLGKFYIDASGNVSASGTVSVLGSGTSTFSFGLTAASSGGTGSSLIVGASSLYSEYPDTFTPGDSKTKLYVYGDLTATSLTDVAQLVGATSTLGAGPRLSFGTYLDNYDGTANIRRLGEIGAVYVGESPPGSGYSNGGSLVFRTEGVAAETGSWRMFERMRLTGTGKLGIGTTDPSENLTVIGNGAFADGSTTSTLTKNSLILGQTSSIAKGKFYVDSTGNLSASGTITAFGSQTSSSSIFDSDELILGKGTGYTQGMFHVDSNGNTNTSGTLTIGNAYSSGAQSLNIYGPMDTDLYIKFFEDNGEGGVPPEYASIGLAGVQNNFLQFNSVSGGFRFNAVGMASSTAQYAFSVRRNNSPIFSISSNGDVRATGKLYASSTVVGTPGNPGDYAEVVDIAIEDIVEPGDIMVVDERANDTYRLSKNSFSASVAGIISTEPSILVGDGKTDYKAQLSLIGRVPVKVTTENGAIARGDLLVSASTTGHAMRYDPNKNSGLKTVGIIGVALEPFDGGASPTGKVMALIRTGWASDYNQTIAELKESISQLAAVQGMQLTVDPDNLNVENNSGKLLFVDSDINFNGYSILNVTSVQGKDNKWAIDKNGNFITRMDTTQGEKEMYAMQSPVSEFVFSSSSQLIAGEARIEFEQTVREIIDPNQPLKVNITLTSGEAKGIYVSEKNTLGFIVKELSNGNSNATFDWMVVAKRKSDE